MSEMEKLPELYPSVSDSRCSSKIRSTISIKNASQITKALGPPLDQLLGLSRHIVFYLKPSVNSDKSPHTPLHCLLLHLFFCWNIEIVKNTTKGMQERLQDAKVISATNDRRLQWLQYLACWKKLWNTETTKAGD